MVHIKEVGNIFKMVKNNKKLWSIIGGILILAILMQGQGQKEGKTTPAECGTDQACLNCVNQDNVCWFSNSESVWYERGYGYANGVCALETFVGSSYSTEAECEQNINPPGSECSDTDGGTDRYVRGTTSNSQGSQTDVCWTSTSVHEFFCSGNNIMDDVLDCPSGYICSDGACTISTCNPPCPPKETIACGVTPNPYDGCFGPCQTGTKCDSGVCNTAIGQCETTSTCTDSDGGENFYVKGTVTSSITGVRTDFCDADGIRLNEWYCAGPDDIVAENTAVTNVYQCSDSCSNGACVGVCTPSLWLPQKATICSGETFTQTSDCDTTRTSTGTKDCNGNGGNGETPACTKNSDCPAGNECNSKGRCVSECLPLIQSWDSEENTCKVSSFVIIAGIFLASIMGLKMISKSN